MHRVGAGTFCHYPRDPSSGWGEPCDSETPQVGNGGLAELVRTCRPCGWTQAGAVSGCAPWAPCPPLRHRPVLANSSNAWGAARRLSSLATISLSPASFPRDNRVWSRPVWQSHPSTACGARFSPGPKDGPGCPRKTFSPPSRKDVSDGWLGHGRLGEGQPNFPVLEGTIFLLHGIP